MTAPEIRRTSLADAFKGSGSDDAAELTGILARRRPAQPASPTPAVEKETATPTVPSAPTARARKTSIPLKKPATEAQTAIRNVPAYIDPDVLTAVRIARRSGIPAEAPDKTYDELLVEALERVTVDQIRNELSPGLSATDAGPLQRRQRRARGRGGVQIQLRMNAAQESDLANLTSDVGAASRSAFVNAAFRLAFL